MKITHNKTANRQPLRALLKLAIIVGLLIAANQAFDHLREALNIDIRPSNENTVHRLIMLASVLYALSLAIPFVPGVEIGIGLIVVFGVKIVPLVYVCTIFGLSLAFAIGRAIPTSVLIKLSHDFHLRKLEVLLDNFDAVPMSEKLDFLVSLSPNLITRQILRYRYLALAILINTPGNFMIGGGGGIALLSGASRLFNPVWFLIVVAFAVAPVPIAVMVFGNGFLKH